METAVGVLSAFLFVSVVINFVLVGMRVLKGARLNYRSKGEFGEDIVYGALKQSGVEPQYLFSNYILKDKDKTREIDQICVNRNGVFVIEVKTYCGKIIGNDDWHEWTQQMPNGEEHRFYNPVKQNFSHLYCLKKLLPEGIPIYNCVVFVSGDIKNVRSAYTMTLGALQMAICNSGSGDRISEEQVEKINEMLIVNEDECSSDEHADSVIKIRDEIASGICPRCKGKLVLRDGPYGKFYGCINYPQCTFKKKIDEPN